MDKVFTWFYPVKVEYQLDFEGKPHPKEIIQTGHIVYGEVLLCKGSREALKNRVGAVKEKKVAHRIDKAGVCKECMEAYKRHPMSVYNLWVRSLNEAATKTEKITATV
jgi:hypothetical protein